MVLLATHRNLDDGYVIDSTIYGYVITDIPVPVGVEAEVTADNTSIRVSWEWLCQSVPDLLRVDYQPEGSSRIMHTVDNTAATSATLTNLQCNTIYTIWVHYAQNEMGASVSKMVYLPARGMYK